MKTNSLTEKTVLLIQALNINKINTIESLHRDLSIPKPTLHRLLHELISLGLVIKYPDTHFYSIRSACSNLSSGVDKELEFVEHAADVATDLTLECEWPVAVATYDDQRMLIRCSSRPDARFSFIKSTVGKRFPLIGSALGEAWLAHRGAADQRRHLSKTASAIIERRLRQVRHLRVSEYLNTVRQQGYALRYGRTGESSHLAIPVIQGKQLLGTIGLSVFTTAVGEQIVPLYLQRLRQAAADITARL